ncbi:dihydrolipoamide acetyltransferase family protein [Microlunatus sp. GCM10028923]|uniref:dihydrolipoamide acetyltransferase family protein n=1 Tax=Microlunatus sp. GCM10028923 TaxID=3273400 RepID=UPI00360C3541
MIDIPMPRLSDTMEEGLIATWRKQPGDPVARGDVLVEIETDKAVMEHEAYQDGTLATILVGEGSTAPIGSPIARLDVGDGSPPATGENTDHGPAILEPATQEAAGRRPATPLVRRLARERGIDLSAITGSGPNGRIVRADLEAPAAATVRSDLEAQAATAVRADPEPAPRPAGDGRITRAVPMSPVRQAIATRLTEAATTIPQFTVDGTADVEELLGLRATINAEFAATDRPGVTVTDLIVRACGVALRTHPELNASYAADGRGQTLFHDKINIGLAVASPNGLVVPVIRDADRLSLAAVSGQARRLVAAAGDRSLTPADLADGTFTVSNLGMFGVERFTAIINPPEGAILAVGSARPEPAVVDGAVVVRRRLHVTLTADHRIIDGADAARFLGTLTRLLEHPLLITVS